MLADAAKPLALTLKLWWRFWPQLVALVLLGTVFGDLFMQIAARTALVNHMAGLALLTLVALTQLIVTVAMFQTLLPALPATRVAQQAARGESEAQPGTGGVRLARMVTVALLPFFAYYAAWGFLGDTVRQYSRVTLDMAPFGEGAGNVLDVLDSRWLIFSVAISWLIRRLAASMQTRGGSRSFWQIVVVICETNWIFIGLYVISRWKDEIVGWIMSRNILSVLQAAAESMANPVASAFADPMVPVEVTSIDTTTRLVNLSFYMLLPVIWLVLAALIYGYDVRDDKELMRVHRRVEHFGERYRAIPKFLRDFVEHFISGYRSRYLPIANGVRITLSSGVVLIVTLIVGYRLIDWLAAWAWLGMTRVIGPHELDTWQVLSEGVSLLFGSPFQDSSTGILVEPIRICFLAAILETAFALPKRQTIDSMQPAGSPAGGEAEAQNV
ncbi:MAG: hypothetical protein EOS58_14515 [Mesorhizobium sp.]|uniref:hypothetical protein n=1 Tax=unclassified Mesorhizobium TaxID=325217 RepID=UPI000FCCD670|nr:MULTISPECIES: hypothetical protein [unclassified Mesorhizobium]RUX49682.1 hypothetical protein EOA33_11790 [Mesorhizobium sp. M4A.F.Ca.ET.050.02.1.1]RVD38057.1 hypothetical protein EN742_18670 [Mesorhizobium sp. M4A.F.Ca.ET.020.02.1.1]RWC12579.1 MAG: hypothetical protein EOS53_25570 [Mesorhizobium sp.]RWD04005.1 MAG: hypothetical protein EOS58_14515 [Mesorhizobium sp.]RWD26674.1 MAG: hypothetical protein EOS22_15525 [Mesorhizobium sp.]